MDLINSERESVIESAIDTISSIGRDKRSRNSVWLQKQSEALGAAEAICGIQEKNRNGGVHNEIAEDSRNLHSDVSSIYQENKFGSIQSTNEYHLHTPAVKSTLERQGTFENSPTLANKSEFSEVTTNVVSLAKHAPNSRIKKLLPDRRMDGNPSKDCALTRANTPECSIEEGTSKGTLHGHEITDLELKQPKSLHSHKDRSTSSRNQIANEAKKISFKGLYSCKIIRRERDVGNKLQRELQMRRKDQGSPKVVRLTQKKSEYNEDDFHSNREKQENPSLVEQMRRWLHIPRSRQGRNEQFSENIQPDMPIPNAYFEKQRDISPHRKVKFHSRSPKDDDESIISIRADSVFSVASSSEPEQAVLSDYGLENTCGGISDTVTYNCMKRTDVHRRIQNLKKLKRSKRKTMPFSKNGSAFRRIGEQTYDDNIAAEQTYRKGFPDRIGTERDSPRISTVVKSQRPKSRYDETGNTTSMNESELKRNSHERSKQTLGASNDAFANTTVHSQRSTAKPKIPSKTTKDVSCGPDSYVTTARQGVGYEISFGDIPTVSSSQKTRDKNVGTKEIEYDSKNNESYAEENIPDYTYEKLYSQLWRNLQSDVDLSQTSNVTTPPDKEHSCCIIYIDGCGNSQTVPRNVWLQLQGR